MSDQPVSIRLEDYQAAPQAIDHVRLTVSLHPTETHVVSELAITPHSKAPLQLHGEGLTLVAVQIDGQTLTYGQYTYANRLLTIPNVPDSPFTLRIEQACNPQANTALSGLYLTNGVYCTQMEAEGFRRFAFMHDRPDVMATYHVRIEAPVDVPVLLSNGNVHAKGLISGTNLHFAEWHDPHLKPTYLFALVAGDLASIHDTFTTASGKEVALGIYVEHGKEDRCSWAMQSLKSSMTWDEQTFGREYDLDVFNIVAVSDFNMGAMENKGLNIFNDKYILARPNTATDMDHVNIERIIAHEYFHNWTGNRITCRDWFQLCLKEGLTVFRDQEFTSDLRSRAVKRIEDVRTLRARQFPEDQGPLAHPVRPSSYIEINNFYTATIYEKGAEICRMLKTLIGPTAFRNAMDQYFERHDGQAATIEDFLRCMSDASGRDLTQFFRWYTQAGTPIVNVSTNYDSANASFEICISQQTPSTPGQTDKQPQHLPLALGLLGPDGIDMPLHLEDVGPLQQPIIEVTKERQLFRFKGVSACPVLSINRGFSAPVKLTTDATPQDLLFLMAHDSDNFNRWESAQIIARQLLLHATSAIAKQGKLPECQSYALALQAIIDDPTNENSFKALMLELASESEVAALIGSDVHSDHVHEARIAVRSRIARHLMPLLHAKFDQTLDTAPYAPDTRSTANRSLRAACLAMITAADPELGLHLASTELRHPANMTAEISALSAVLQLEAATPLLEQFLHRHGDDHLLVDKWLMLQSQRTTAGAAARVVALTAHPLFQWTTPNRVHALLSGFCANPSGFHAANGEGYRVIANAIVKLNGINPQVAARLATGFRSWRQYDAPRQVHAKANLQLILASPGLSPDVYEIISRTLD